MKRWLIALLVLTLAVGSFALVASAAKKTQMIMLTASGISPKTANIEKGTTVVWVNNSNANLGLFFSRGKEVEAVCAAPTRFALDADGNYNSGGIPQGGTASRFCQLPLLTQYGSGVPSAAPPSQSIMPSPSCPGIAS